MSISAERAQTAQPVRVTEGEIVDASARLTNATPQEVLRWTIERFGSHVALACSFSIEDCVVLDMAHQIDRSIRVFALDTGRLPDETYLTAERIRAKYGTVIEWHFPEREPVERLVQLKGLYSFRDSLEERHECCGIRKVAPLGRALGGLAAWITGLRREQSVTRSAAPVVEFDREHGGIAKINPIIAWTTEEVRRYATERRVPIHPLHDRGYPSIGCAPCTRAVAPGEHPRAGRWWWENPENKECGLHPVK